MNNFVRYLGEFDAQSERYDFPLGNATELSPEERALLEQFALVRRDGAAGFERPGVAHRLAYKLVALAVRAAVFARREKCGDLLRDGLIGLVLDNGCIDYRDLLMALCIIEDCAQELHVDLTFELTAIQPFARRETWETIAGGFLVRPPEMRTLKTFGVRRLDANGPWYGLLD